MTLTPEAARELGDVERQLSLSQSVSIEHAHAYAQIAIASALVALVHEVSALRVTLELAGGGETE